MNPTDPTAMHMVIDTETSSTDPAIERIKAIAGAGGTLRDGITRSFKIFVDAEGRRSNAEALAIHRIPDDVGGVMAEGQALAILEAMTADARIVMQNASFDVGFLVAAYERQKRPLPPWLRDPSQVVDTMDMGKARHPGRQLNLDNLGRLCGVDPALIKRREHKHDVLEDCELAFAVWQRLATPVTLDLQQAKAPAKAEAVIVEQTAAPEWL